MAFPIFFLDNFSYSLNLNQIFDKTGQLKVIDKIRVFGAKEHNLKSVNVEIPKNSLTVITGPSGSGKSSLALDTLFAEGQRRYIESLSSYARQFLGVNKKPDIDRIEGLCPSIAIEQKTVGFNPRSTVGTTTEIYDYLRVFFARLGIISCPECNKELMVQSPEEISESLMLKHKGETLFISAEVVSQRKGEFKNILKDFFSKGYDTFFIDNKIKKFETSAEFDELRLGKNAKHTIYIILDKLIANEEHKDYLFLAVKKAFSFAHQGCSVIFPNKKNEVRTYSSKQICLNCVVSFPTLEPRLFSFNSPVGACQGCNGLGIEFVWGSLSNNLFKEALDDDFENARYIPCTTCFGARLNKSALAVRVNGKNIFEVSSLPLKDLKSFLEKLVFSGNEAKIAERVMYELQSRTNFLIDVGLDYLTLSRNAATLSGGESQRIRLATQIGTSLSGVLYVLDEPSIGLHQRDNDRLIITLKKLRDLNNTVIVVEHDLDTINSADYLIDMGPGSGVNGGYVVAAGDVMNVSLNPNSVTGPYLSGKKKIEVPTFRRPATIFLEIKNASKNNLKNIDVKIPLGVFVAVTGVSGSGKSSLISQSLAPALNNYFTRGYCISDGIENVLGLDKIKSVIFVDQKSIGKTSRSNPATYLGLFNDIRTIFSKLPESKVRGYGPGHFSFNVDGGRCTECSGDGQLKISMQFLEDVIITCKSCNGKRYDPFILEVKYKNKNIADILAMSAEEALPFFEGFQSITKKLELMCDVGLEYITLGQPSPTISGGEAQRIKLVNELVKRGLSTLYILDEPTTGLHFVDIEKLLKTLNRLVNRGNTVLVIEHNLDVVKCADYIIDIGPGSGSDGGTIVFSGTPEELIKHKDSVTGQYLTKYL